MEVRVSSTVEAPKKYQFIEFESGHVGDSKFPQDIVSLPVDLKSSDDCELVQDFFILPSPSFHDHKSYETNDDFKLVEDFLIESCDKSYKNQDDIMAPLGSLSSEDTVNDLSANYLFRDIWRLSSPICLTTKIVMKSHDQQADVKDSFDDSCLDVKRFIPLFHAADTPINNENCRDAHPAEIESHPVLEYFARRNSSSSFFLREFDFYKNYDQCLKEEQCFACTEKSMSWANYPCCHLLWCDDCGKHLVEAAANSEHKCVICDAKVENMLHNLNSTSLDDDIEPHSLESTDYKELPTLDAGNLKSLKVDNEDRSDLVQSQSISSMDDGYQPLLIIFHIMKKRSVWKNKTRVANLTNQLNPQLALASEMTDAKLGRRPGPAEPNSPTTGCERLQRALSDCHRRIPVGRARESACRHLNRSMAECLVSVVCPDEVEAVRTLCSSSGTSLKRSQCQGAQLSLAVCLSSHQIDS